MLPFSLGTNDGLPDLLTGPIIGKYRILTFSGAGQDDFLAPYNWC